MPSEFEMCVKANSFTSGVSNRKLIQRERAVFTHRHKTQPRAGSLREQLPRHEIAVVLHFSEKNHIVRAEKFSAPCLRDQVDALRRPAGEDDFVRTRRAEIAAPRVAAISRRPRSRGNSVRADRDAHWRCRARSNAGAHR